MRHAAEGRNARHFSYSSSCGVAITLDDFGTGESSLSYLHELPFQRLKIDRSFVVATTDGEKPTPLLESIVRMSKNLGMKTIAEGIERVEQMEILRLLGFDEGQGYYFSNALPANEFLSLWRNWTETGPRI
jgi:EAL domain-containing protein (putative c-di-GMP-specific phosphodiesterase class I)